MTCDRWQAKLYSYVDSELSESELADLEIHLRTCLLRGRRAWPPADKEYDASCRCALLANAAVPPADRAEHQDEAQAVLGGRLDT